MVGSLRWHFEGTDCGIIGVLPEILLRFVAEKRDRNISLYRNYEGTLVGSSEDHVVGHLFAIYPAGISANLLLAMINNL